MTALAPRPQRRVGRAALVVSVLLAGVVAVVVAARRPSLAVRGSASPLTEVGQHAEAPSPRATTDDPSAAEADARRPNDQPRAELTAALPATAPPAEPAPVRPRVLELEQAGPFATREAERSFWQERLVGERLTLDGRSQSFGALKRALDQGSLSDRERTALERRQTELEAKLGEQTQRVALIERRIDELAAP